MTKYGAFILGVFLGTFVMGIAAIYDKHYGDCQVIEEVKE